MAATEAVARLTPYIEQLLEDKAARNDLRRGAEKLRAAYERSQKRHVKKRRGRVLLKVLPLAAVGAGVAIALNEDLRSSLFGSSSTSPEGFDGSQS